NLIDLFNIVRRQRLPTSSSIDRVDILTLQVKEFSVIASPETFYKTFYIGLAVDVVGDGWQALQTGDEDFSVQSFLDFGVSLAVARVHEVQPNSRGATLLVSIRGVTREPDLVPPTIAHSLLALES